MPNTQFYCDKLSLITYFQLRLSIHCVLSLHLYDLRRMLLTTITIPASIQQITFTIQTFTKLAKDINAYLNAYLKNREIRTKNACQENIL